ncbi:MULTISPECIES: NADase-type glycan-binding domain-containing protein [Leptospira]|uniref:Lipoprotein n=1 Tax=Leptospira licerasiae str. MMD4847 TaxID=1049971 RepID=A0ABP2RIX9_9LEPT|nr:MULTISPECIES: hypothetical protein [Leptospira]EIE01305.1 hypothetical protein LEP1GSC185_3434 [Leptospira licerasiae serovar Varillal str. VAR 010]EJZ43518.1 putative lipoprotein [Leptospira licerasiae str. MMD4847]EMK01217.1 putative lipoprotein [Leptospira sp. B5-022]MCR1795793.1 hypothetical protein [Leptospira sp. id769339]
MNRICFVLLLLTITACKNKEVHLGVEPSEVVVSSFLSEGETTYSGNKLFDDFLDPWCEGTNTEGIGETITLNFPDKKVIDSFLIKNGYAYGKLFSNNNRVKDIEVEEANGKKYNFTIIDQPESSVIRFPEKLETDRLKFIILSVYKGKANDTCISEISINSNEILSDSFDENAITKKEADLRKAKEELEYKKETAGNDIELTYTNADSQTKTDFSLTLEGISDASKVSGNASISLVEDKIFVEYAHTWHLSCDSWTRSDKTIKVRCSVREDLDPGYVEPGKKDGIYRDKKIGYRFINIDMASKTWVFERENGQVEKLGQDLKIISTNIFEFNN